MSYAGAWSIIFCSLALSVSIAPTAAAQSATDSASADSASSASADSASASWVAPLALVQGHAADQMRLEHLRPASQGSDRSLEVAVPAESYLIRSASSLNARPRRGRGWSASLIAPELYAAHNTAIPHSMNDGAVWAGVGTSTRLLTGVQFSAGPLRIILAPEFIRSENAFFVIRDTLVFYAPPVPEDRRAGGFVFPWYALGPYSIDLPVRFGSRSIERVDAGQSTAMLEQGGVAAGVSNENQWWGPGIRNALVLSNTAPGFPHLFVRTSKPWRTRAGAVEARLIVGGLTESNYFDTTSTNDLRSLSAFAVTLQPAFSKNLVIGAARSVYESADDWGLVPGRILHAFMATGRPNDRPLADSAVSEGGRDQIFSLFGRWVFPSDGFEVWTEWARLEFPASFKDLLIAPQHSQGYTLGLQWTRPALRPSGRIRLQGEMTNVEQSGTFRDRPQGSFYTSRKVIQGYTQMGQPLAAGIGPGASGQWLAADYIEPAWSFGIFAGRIRWNQDIQSTYGFPIYQGYCIHDITVFPGARGFAGSRFGYISADVTFGNRLNAFFQEQSGCPKGNSIRDIRNRTLTVTVGTFTPGRPR